MKKLAILSFFCLLLVGCADMMNTPTKRVEEFLGKYQIMDREVIEQLEHTIEKDQTLSEEQKKSYQALMEKQYQNLSYKIKEETIDGNQATVTVEIQVFDYQNALTKADDYIAKNEKKFSTDGKRDLEKEMDYKITQMESVTDKISYFQEEDILKIHGLYNSEN